MTSPIPARLAALFTDDDWRVLVEATDLFTLDGLEMLVRRVRQVQDEPGYGEIHLVVEKGCLRFLRVVPSEAFPPRKFKEVTKIGRSG